MHKYPLGSCLDMRRRGCECRIFGKYGATPLGQSIPSAAFTLCSQSEPFRWAPFSRGRWAGDFLDQGRTSLESFEREQGTDLF
ncbi:hypothetical protein VTK56DRAFT_5970 [Thermocarpiscus australiensis]